MKSLTIGEQFNLQFLSPPQRQGEEEGLKVPFFREGVRCLKDKTTYRWVQSINKVVVRGGAVTKSCPTFATPWTVALQVPLSMGFLRQEYWNE